LAAQKTTAPVSILITGGARLGENENQRVRAITKDAEPQPGVKFNFHSSAPSFYHFLAGFSSTKDFIGL
jgi:hypothetical protein